MVTPPPPGGFEEVIYSRNLLDPVSTELADRCCEAGNAVIEIVKGEEGEDSPNEEISDPVIAAHAVAAHQVYKVFAEEKGPYGDRLTQSTDLHPMETFLGLSLLMLETPEAERSPYLNNVTHYLLENYEWADLPGIYREVLLPTVCALAHHYEPLLPKELRLRAAELSLAVCVAAQGIYEKLKSIKYNPDGQFGKEIWNKFQSTMRWVGELEGKNTGVPPLSEEDIANFRAVREKTLVRKPTREETWD